MWIGADGTASLTPPVLSGVVIAGVSTGTYWLFVAAAGLAAVYVGVVFVLDHRRMAEWEREWASVEPGWRRQTL